MEWIAHDNQGVPFGLTPRTTVLCDMSDGSSMHGEVQDIDWAHDKDPVVRYKVLQFVPGERVQ